MKTYEFKTAVSDGEEIIETSFFPYFAVDTTDYVFDREEANER